MAVRLEITGRKFTSKRGVATRYDVAPRTIDRWVAAGVLPPSDLVIRGRHYWDEAALDRHDRRRTVEHATAPSAA